MPPATHAELTRLLTERCLQWYWSIPAHTRPPFTDQVLEAWMAGCKTGIELVQCGVETAWQEWLEARRPPQDAPES